MIRVSMGQDIEIAPTEHDPELGDVVTIPDVCGGSWWAALHSIVENAINCSACREHAVQLMSGMHDLVNLKLGKPLFDAANFRQVAGWYTQAAETGHATLEQAVSEWRDWIEQIAAFQRACAVADELVERIQTGGPLAPDELEQVQEWLDCLQDSAFLVPALEILEEASRQLHRQTADSEAATAALARYDALLETHRADPCVEWLWLAKRTYRFRDTPSVTISQFRRLNRPHQWPEGGPNGANVLKGKLVAWHIAVDSVASELGYDSDAFANCILAAYDRHFDLLETLDEVLSHERKAEQRQDGPPGASGALPHDGGRVPLRHHGNQSQTVLHQPGGAVRREVLARLTEGAGQFVRRLSRETRQHAHHCADAILSDGDREPCRGLKASASELADFGLKQGRLFQSSDPLLVAVGLAQRDRQAEREVGELLIQVGRDV